MVVCLTEPASQPVDRAEGASRGRDAVWQDENGACLIFACDSQTSGFPARSEAELLPQSDVRHC
jgi:hypothetical protein